ncbi:MAG: XTP/dITP diphosphatase [Parachlamydiaceae bacterium]|nr:XTP/dITP diphosphatase [Parachlamydiaceae bacterium]
MEIVLATSNLHKIREFKDMLKALSHIDLLSLHQFPQYEIPEETGSTFKENAILKAEKAAKELNKWVLADDSGLIVPALKGEPGLHSARYAGPQATDTENRKKLLQAMENLSDHQRNAYCECCIAIASPDGLKKCVTGLCEGYILTEERGRNGFGYDPLFVKNDYQKSFAELDNTTKNLISHRRKAIERILAFLESLRE